MNQDLVYTNILQPNIGQQQVINTCTDKILLLSYIVQWVKLPPIPTDLMNPHEAGFNSITLSRP